MKELFNTLIFNPLYNALVWILSVADWMDVGMAVIVLTILVKVLILPLALKASRHQQQIRALEGPMKELREKHKDNKEEQGRKMLELYKEHGTNPLTGIFLLLIQIPVIIGLFFVFLKGGLPEINTELLYSFVHTPENVNMFFLGFLDMAGKSLPLAVAVGLTQFYQVRLTMPAPGARKEDASLSEDFARSMQLNIRYVLPAIITVFAYMLSAAVALYWITSNIFAIGQELYVKRELAAKEGKTTA